MWFPLEVFLMRYGDNVNEFVLWFEDIGKEDREKVGGKSANLGELAKLNIPVLPGFATTISAYDYFMERTRIRHSVEELLRGLNADDIHSLQENGKKIRSLIKNAHTPPEFRKKITKAYQELSERLGVEEPEVAVRSSATAEDVEGASFAGQQETYLNVKGEEELMEAVKKCFASLFTNRAISYREDKDFSHFDVKLSCAIQKMARSDIASSGVMFSIDPDTGFENAIIINAAYGLGETVVQGQVNPDEYVVFKKNTGIIEKKLGNKEIKLVRGEERGQHKEVPTSEDERNSFCLNDDQIKELANYARKIENHYDQAMDMEWAHDGQTDELYLIQARPETVHSIKAKTIENYNLGEEEKEKSELLLEGTAIGSKIGSGKAKVLKSAKEIDRFEEGEVLITDMTDPDWEPIMKQASAIVTDKGGKTSHAAIVSRELGIPAVIGSDHATTTIRTGDEITVDCSSGGGKVWKGELDFDVEKHDLEKIPETETDVLVNIGEPSEAFSVAQLPVQGSGLVREEFIISSWVEEHPLALIEKGEEEKFIRALRYGLGKIAAAFHPRDIIVRLSDFKSDEYKDLKGGEGFEPEEANPMLGWRGASRYYDEEFEQAFELELEAIKRTKDELEIDNIILMVPFCRTIEEAEKVRNKIDGFGLDLEVYVMAEIPSNVILGDEFAQMFDGFSIGTNDLTQLTLGVDRNSDKLNCLFDERNEAVKKSVRRIIDKAHNQDKKIGICGDAPSSYKQYARFLVEAGIDTISVSPDVALKTIMRVKEAEEAVEDTVKDKEFDSQELMGTAAGEVYNVLEDSQEVTVEEIETKTPPEICKDTINQSLGWLGKEDKIRVFSRDGVIKYGLKGG